MLRSRHLDRGEQASRTALDRLLGRAERTIALIERARPLNAVSEHERLCSIWQRGDRRAPELVYARAPQLGEFRAALELIVERLSGSPGWCKLYVDRAAELLLEAHAAEAVGCPDFAQRARERYPVAGGRDGRRAAEWARNWTGASSTPAAGQAHPSDDERDPLSLFSAMRRAVGEFRLPFRVRLTPDLPCAAATGERLILVRAGTFHTESAVRRIVLHEIEGHAVPRARAAHEPLGLFLVGSAGGADDEEGRALLLEENAGCLDGSRRSELARRHFAALSVRDGANWVDTAELLLDLGADLKGAFELATRVHRGGGLAREVVYLPAFARVRAALGEEPELSDWLARGRLSIAAARELRKLGDPPELAA